jgi:hypothetical protein
MKIGLLSAKGGSGRSVTAQVLANGLVLEGQETTLLEFVPAGHRSALTATHPPAFQYQPVSMDDGISGAALATRIAATSATGYLVIDLPSLAPDEAAAVLPTLDLALVPVHPDPADLVAARSLLEVLNALPAAKSGPPRWVVHLDEIQSLRGPLSLIDQLVVGWPSGSLPPMVLPWTLPRLIRAELRQLASGARVSDTLASACRILALAVQRVASAGLDDMLLPKAFEDNLPETLKSRFRGEDRSLAEKLAGLAADVAAIRSGEGPRPSDLLGTPVLDNWSLEPFRAHLLAGTVRGHPRLGDSPVRTTMAVLVDENEGWARTLSRYYRLGRKAKRRRVDPDDGPLT